MKIALLALVLSTGLLRGQQLNVYVSGNGDKWYSASQLEKIATDYAKERKIKFSFEGTERSVWVNTGGSNIVASVSFSSGIGKPSFMVDIDRSGKVVTNYLGLAVCGGASRPEYVDLQHADASRTNRLQRTPR